VSTKQLKNFVGGKQVAASSGEVSDVINPSTGQVYAHAPVSNEQDVAAAYEVAQKAFEEWGQTTPSERQLALFRIADALEARAKEAAEVESENTGKPLSTLVDYEIMPSVDQIRFFAGAARNLEGRSAGEYLRDHTSMIRREPIGVIGQVTPWNYPLNMATWKFAPAIAAGNTIVLKPSDTTPASTLLLAEIAAEFLPAGVFNVVTGNRDTGRAMIENRIPQMVSITGSVRAGMEVAKSASADLKRVHLELGGKAPVIVFADADFAKTAAGIVAAGFFNAGQDCTAATRLLVQESAYDEFMPYLLAEVKASAKVGKPSEEDILFGPVNNANQLARVKGFIDRLPDHARIEAGGNQIGSEGYFFEPTVLVDVKPGSAILNEEIFGPVAPIVRFKDEDEAIRLANDTEYGLVSYAYTQDLKRGIRLIERLDTGMTGLNTGLVSNAAAPFGGVKQSGLGREGGLEGIHEYLETKYVMIPDPSI
jgi:betaine-aldehyde dehydrogenase